MATLTQIADQLADSLNRPFDDMLKLRLVALIKQEFATLVRQQINKYGLDGQFKTKYSVKIHKVNLGDSPYSEVEDPQTTFRTINKVARPIRYNTDDPFTYVGGVNGKTPYIYSKLAELSFTSGLPAVQQSYQLEEGQSLVKPSRYTYDNGYIYIYDYNGEEDIDEQGAISIEGVHSSYPFINTETADSTNLVYLDTVEFPMPDDLIQTIKERLLKGELSIIDDKDKIPSRHIDNN